MDVGVGLRGERGEVGAAHREGDVGAALLVERAAPR